VCGLYIGKGSSFVGSFKPWDKRRDTHIKRERHLFLIFLKPTLFFHSDSLSLCQKSVRRWQDYYTQSSRCLSWCLVSSPWWTQGMLLLLWLSLSMYKSCESLSSWTGEKKRNSPENSRRSLIIIISFVSPENFPCGFLLLYWHTHTHTGKGESEREMIHFLFFFMIATLEECHGAIHHLSNYTLQECCV